MATINQLKIVLLQSITLQRSSFLSFNIFLTFSLFIIFNCFLDCFNFVRFFMCSILICFQNDFFRSIAIFSVPSQSIQCSFILASSVAWLLFLFWSHPSNFEEKGYYHFHYFLLSFLFDLLFSSSVVLTIISKNE